MSVKRGLYWFYNDLRLHDNALLRSASVEMEVLHCFYFSELKTLFDRRFLPIEIDDDARQEFRMQAVGELNQSLWQLGQTLHQVLVNSVDEAVNALSEMVNYYAATDLYISFSASWYVEYVVRQTQVKHPRLNLHRCNNGTLFQHDDLPFLLNALPSTFSGFRKKIERIDIPSVAETTTQLPPPMNTRDGVPLAYGTAESTLAIEGIRGGELAGLRHVRHYFATDAALSYKLTRNRLDDWTGSTKFSLWLANGNVSPKTIVQQLRKFERKNGANESTYWIVFELLWREYFYWYGCKYGARLFAFKGIKDTPPLTTFYASRFRQWAEGKTPYPIVNACMNQLKRTGYMSNRGRQLVASCFVHELGLDWRFGACYFQHMLIDYDVGSNWGNWQYLAGVGADPRGHRQFDLSKQTQLYDPDGIFVRKWKGNTDSASLDTVDIVDWPIQD
ncbi:DASH family cryptochrome [Vibrio parahaemolyticus]